MNSKRNFFRSLVLPVTPLVVLAAISLILFIWAFIVIFTTSEPTAFLAAFTVAFSLVIFVLYIIDRIIVQKVNYKIMFFGELLFLLFITFSFWFSISMIDLNISTDKDYIVVLFDSKENRYSDFERKGLFGKELYVNDHIIHVDSSLAKTTKFRILVPDDWKERSYIDGRVNLSGRSIKYVLQSTHNLDLTIEDLIDELNEE